MQIVSSLRRQAKNEQQDYKDIADDLIKMKASLKTIERKLRDNLAFRKKSVDQNGVSKKAGTQIKLETYLESLGLNPQDFLENQEANMIKFLMIWGMITAFLKFVMKFVILPLIDLLALVCIVLACIVFGLIIPYNNKKIYILVTKTRKNRKKI